MRQADSEPTASPSASTEAAAGSSEVAASPPASKLLCLIRHGQGVHNPRQNPLALAWLTGVLRKDARLTGKGRRQAGALAAPMEHLPFDLVVVSPLTRTIETATAAFGSHPTPKRLCHLMCERTMMPADQGTPKAELLKMHPQLATWDGFDELPEEFWPPLSAGRAAEEEVAGRVGQFKQWLLARPEACLACVGHSAFFRTFTGLPKLANCEAFWCELRPDGSVVECTPLPPPPSAEADGATTAATLERLSDVRVSARTGNET